jgi:two-component system sensor histidine kinase UhpB
MLWCVVMSVTNIASNTEFSGVVSPGEALRLPRLRFAAWHWLSLRGQLLIVFILIDLIAAFVAGGVMIMRARTSTRVEIAASMNLAEALVAETLRVTQQQSPANALSETRSLRGPFMRHVRISVRNAADLPLMTGPAPVNADADRAAPAWFMSLIAPPVERRDLPIIAGGQRVGSILITGEASDEVAEVWENTLALGAAGAVLNVAVILLLYALFGRVLKPLTGFAHGLRDLEQRNYRVRLVRPGAPELGVIADRFNALAQALDALRAENNELNRRVITAQDDERRRTALELHDEVGPCLFGLKANATSIAAITADSPGGVAERARDVLAIVEHLQSINRSLLNRLRPMALGHVPLGDLVAELVSERARQHPQTQVSFTPGRLLPSYGDSIDLTVYRCIQESLTNALRHANATRVTIELGEAGHRAVQVRVCDDGCGIDAKTPPGRGLLGMQERVQALGGSFVIDGAQGNGTRVQVLLPIKPADGASS